MDQALSSRATRMLACIGALLSASGCLTGVNVGQDGQGGHPASTSSSTGGDAPTGASCTSPRQLLCPWGKPGGPCGGSRPNKKDCDSGWVCLGDTADTEGTCGIAGDTLLSPGDSCVNPVSAACPWDYACNSTFFPGGAGGTCSATNCTLEDPGAGPVSAASVTFDGDGPTKHFDFACAPAWGSNLTGEANLHVGSLSDPPGKNWLFMNGCGGADGQQEGGTLFIAAPLMGVGTVNIGEISYTMPYVNGVDLAGNYVNDMSGGGMTVTLTEVTADIVRGTFDAMVTNGAAPEPQKHLTGTFDVCRLPDHVTP